MTDNVGRDLILPEDFRINVRDSLAHLDHASTCNHLNCQNSTCTMIKMCFQHFTKCLHFSSCENCDHFFNLVARHASSCEIESCPTILCGRIKQAYKCMFRSKEESRKETDPGPSSSEPVLFESSLGKYPNLDEKLYNYLKSRKEIFKRARLGPPEEILPFLEFIFQPNAPSTSRDVYQGQGYAEHRSKRFKKEHTDETTHSMD
ncbi:hypothetical protein TNIN_463021 [Trichonephila inaurata madagascariensis]|uniref:TAZ-type domain-containing protein n=1 Tax=Trichonephila inaurata madagascariensis TaxID=2747483 RepID=A0A8X6Y2A0_9ARAC|nr:hypothetical protein TNIN_463021 [Trichonephila inaurata madagascariensis]